MTTQPDPRAQADVVAEEAAQADHDKRSAAAKKAAATRAERASDAEDDKG